jgi:hypothetical protein
MRDQNRLVFQAVLCGGLLAACQSDPPEGAAPPPVDASTSVSADKGIAELGVAELGVADAAQPPIDQGQADTDTGYCFPVDPAEGSEPGKDWSLVDQPILDCIMDREEGTLLSKSNCQVDYPGADPCYQCVIERCCRWSQCASLGARQARIYAVPGEDLWDRWPEYIVPPALDPGLDQWRYSWPHSIHVACVRNCIDGSPADGPNAPSASERLTACVDACVDLVVPDCDNNPDPRFHRYRYPYRQVSEEFMACLFTGPEGNATLNHPNDRPYPYFHHNLTLGTDGDHYVTLFADTSCAAVCFGAEP